MFDVIVDIDGTIADNEHRCHHLRDGKKDWVAYKEGILKDGTHEDIIFICEALVASGARIVLCTGREECERMNTMKWLVGNGLHFWDKLYMRKNKDYRSDDVVKAELLEQIIADGYKPKIALEDRQRVVDMWRAKGIRCLQVQPGDF